MTQTDQGATVEALLAHGEVSAADVERARERATVQGKPVLEVLLADGVIDRRALLRMAAVAAGVDHIDLSDHPVDASAAALVPGDFARRSTALAFGWSGTELLVAVPLRGIADLDLKDDLARLSGRRIRLVLGNRAEIENRINQIYRAEGELADLTANLVVEEEQPDLDSFTEVAGDAPVVRFVSLLISQAISDRASDIHIEPTEHEVRVRYRIDGVLQDAHRAPRGIHAGVVSRLKIMAEMDIAERRVPQDGRLSVNHQGKVIDLRIATLPTVWGEKIVARVLDNSNTRLGLSDLGFSRPNFDRFAQSYTKPYGMILVTGPTGSGKSTTLYATLNVLNQPHVNVITVEDPVEYRLAGINQVQTNNKAGLTFASALRSILRSDPDIVLIGEIRDMETATIAVEASLTGHLVLSTLHTNDAPSAVTRLVEMGIEPFLVGSALDAVVGQRLCRQLCERCREPYLPPAEELEALGLVLAPGVDQLYRPRGCTSCAGTGYRGRMALHEVMSVSEDIERLTVARASTDEIGKVARAQGMATLREDGWLKVQQGKTSIEEVLRVVG
ncbi:GspE/PulE family protein [Nocardioides sambongensis]|uniref:GspE/PulE family protein n=1 Tax=Nocardioides sambongensis TaxID=2589074 RepID=UPI00112B020C|nr:ATPase, T2SS/T4P/T4SS family [Nocardioides sambongensis]